MQFERDDDDQGAANLELESVERRVLNDSILHSFVKALQEKDSSTPIDPKLINLGRLLLSSKFVGGTRIKVRHDHAQLMSDSVADHLRDVSYEEVGLVGGLAAQLGAVARLLAGEDSPLSTLPTEEEIDQIVADFEVPDYPEDLDGS